MNETTQEMPLKEKIDLLFNKVNEGNIKKKDMKILRKAKVNGRKQKKGWMGILKIDENMNISGERQQIDDSTIKLSDGTYHAVNGEELLMWNGKFPVLIQPTWRLNPLKIKKENKENQTYGQKYVMARMLKDAIIAKSKVKGNVLIWILVAGAVAFGIKYFFF